IADMERIRALRIPGGVSSILMEKVESLAAHPRAMFEIASVMGETMDLELLTKVSDLTPEETFAAVRELVRQAVADESSDGATIMFPQSHLRDSVYSSMPARRRMELPQRIAGSVQLRALSGTF